MSYNVRLFNQFKWLNKEQIPLKIEQFIQSENPDIVCLQEYSSQLHLAFESYPYRYVRTASALGNNGVGIFSKYPLLRTGQLILKIALTVGYMPILNTEEILYASTTSI